MTDPICTGRGDGSLMVLMAPKRGSGLGSQTGSAFAVCAPTLARCEKLLGQPSLVVGHDGGYAHADDAHGWAFVDFEHRQGPEHVRFVRDVRLPRTPARSGLILVP